MTEIAAQPTGATPSGTSSTPATGTAPATAQPAEVKPTAAAPSAETRPTTETKPADGVTTEGVKPTEATKPAEAVKPVETTAAAPLFTLPDDMKVSDGARTKFEAAIKGKMKDGALQLTPQDVVDLYAEQARDAFTAWQQQITTQDAAWKTESESRFSKAQLAAAETGVGFLSSFDPQFRDLTKGIANHPAFVNAMRVIGERLSEDTFEIEGARPAGAQRKSAADVLYGKRN